MAPSLMPAPWLSAATGRAQGAGARGEWGEGATGRGGACGVSIAHAGSHATPQPRRHVRRVPAAGACCVAAHTGQGHGTTGGAMPARKRALGAPSHPARALQPTQQHGVYNMGCTARASQQHYAIGASTARACRGRTHAQPTARHQASAHQRARSTRNGPQRPKPAHCRMRAPLGTAAMHTHAAHTAAARCSPDAHARPAACPAQAAQPSGQGEERTRGQGQGEAVEARDGAVWPGGCGGRARGWRVGVRRAGCTTSRVSMACSHARATAYVRAPCGLNA